MSIKIYDGLRVARGQNPFTTARQVREVLEPMFYTAFRQTGPTTGIDVFDHWDKIDRLHRDPVRGFDPADIGYDVVLLPHRLLLLFSQHAPYRRALLDSGLVTEYGYWDNTDAPEGVTSNAWGWRRRLWAAALDDFDAAPSEAGLRFGHPGKVTTSLRVRKAAIPARA